MSMSMADISSVKSSLSNITHLSDDLLAEIFHRLPLRSVARCKCVSKRWLGVISSPNFLRLFTSHQHSLFKALLVFMSPRLLMLTFFLKTPPPLAPALEQSHSSHDPIPTPPTSLGFIGQTLLSPEMLIKGDVCGCSNGVLLCCNNRYTTGHGYYVYEPLTKECIQIPPSPVFSKNFLYAVGFVCHPYYHAQETTTVTLNPDRRFRVVIIKAFIIQDTELSVYVFSSETRKWEQPVVILQSPFAFGPHWHLSFAREEKLYFMGRTSILVYDPFDHHSDTLDYPSDTDPMNIMSFGSLGTSCGNLRIANIGSNDVSVWELMDNRWHLLHRANLSTYLPAKFCANYFKRVGGFHPHDRDIVYLCSYADGIFIANLRTNKFEVIPGHERTDIIPFQLELPLLPPSMPSQE